MAPSDQIYQPGDLVAHTYRIENLVARGGVGEIYRAVHEALGTTHALKVLQPQVANDPKVSALFQRESAVLRNLNHSAIVLTDGAIVDEAGRLCLIMEFVTGPSLLEVMGKRPLTADEVRQLCGRLADGLAVAHDMGVVHRDLSPDNVIFQDGRMDRAKIIDFGIAKFTNPDDSTIIGRDFAGKFGYASPEAAGLFGGEVDRRSDIYSLALVLAAAARGKAIDMGRAPQEIFAKRRELPDLSDVPKSLRPGLAAMLQPDPADRPQSMRELDWTQAGGTGSAKPARRRRVALPLGLVASLALAAGAWFFYRGGAGPEGDPPAVPPLETAEVVPPPEAPPQQSTQAESTPLASSGAAPETVGQAAPPGDAPSPEAETPSQPEPAAAPDPPLAELPAIPEPPPVEVPAVPEVPAIQSVEPNVIEAAPVETAATSGAPAAATAELPAVTAAPTIESAEASAAEVAPVEATPAAPAATATQAPKVEDSAVAEPAPEEPAQSPSLAALPLETRVAKAMAGFACSSLVADLAWGKQLAVSGYLANEADQRLLRQRIEALDGLDTVSFDTRIREGHFCAILGALTDLGVVPAKTPANAMLRLNHGDARYRGGDALIVTATTPRGPQGYLYVDYIDRAGAVFHILPSSFYRENRFSGGKDVTLGTAPEVAGSEDLVITIDRKDYGSAMVLALYSPRPLFAAARAQGEPAGAYLEALRGELGGGSDARGGVVFLETVAPD